MSALETQAPGMPVVRRTKYSRWHQLRFNSRLLAQYHLLGLLGRVLPKPRPHQPGRPLRVFRLASLIAQGGVAKVCLQTLLATDPKQATIHINVFDSHFPLPSQLARRPDISVHHRRMRLWCGSYHRRVFRGVTQLASQMRRFKPDVIHVHEPQFAPVARMAAIAAGNIPLFVHLHNDYNERWKERAHAPVQDRLIRHALVHSHLIACSDTIRRAGAQWLDLPLERIHLIEDGADDVRPSETGDRLVEELPQAARGRKVIVKMSHAVGHKRIDDYMAACRMLLDEGLPVFALLMCYGKSKATRALRRQFESMFAPWEGELLLHVANPQALLPHCAIGVSTSALEGLGLNILEFQAAGLPVVCTDLPPHREMVEDGRNGLLFETGNVGQLAGHLRRLLQEPAEARRLAEAGRQSARQRTWKKTADETLELYRRVIAG